MEIIALEWTGTKTQVHCTYARTRSHTSDWTLHGKPTCLHVSQSLVPIKPFSTSVFPSAILFLLQTAPQKTTFSSLNGPQHKLLVSWSLRGWRTIQSTAPVTDSPQTYRWFKHYSLPLLDENKMRHHHFIPFRLWVKVSMFLKWKYTHGVLKCVRTHLLFQPLSIFTISESALNKV